MIKNMIAKIAKIVPESDDVLAAMAINTNPPIKIKIETATNMIGTINFNN